MDTEITTIVVPKKRKSSKSLKRKEKKETKKKRKQLDKQLENVLPKQNKDGPQWPHLGLSDFRGLGKSNCSECFGRVLLAGSSSSMLLICSRCVKL